MSSASQGAGWAGITPLHGAAGDPSPAPPPLPWEPPALVWGVPCLPPITEHSFAPQGGRFKKEIVVDGQSYLLLIRDEGGPPELQVGDLSSLGSLPTTLVRGWPGLWLPLLAAPGRAVRPSVCLSVL